MTPGLVVQPAIPADFIDIRLRPEQEYSRESLIDCASSPQIVGSGWTGRRTDTYEILVIAGILPRWPGHGTAWSYISADIRGREWVQITRAVRQHVDAALSRAYHRIETWCYAEPEAWACVARRWAERLGFQHEGLARKFDPHGRDVHIYSRVRDG